MRLAFATRRATRSESLCVTVCVAHRGGLLDGGGAWQGDLLPGAALRGSEVSRSDDRSLPGDRDGPALLDADLITQLTLVNSVGSDVNHCSLFATNEHKLLI